MSRTNNGWIKLHRRFLKSPVWRNPNLVLFWIWCLLKAVHEPTTVVVGKAKVALQPGQFIFTRSMASMETGLSEKVVRNCLDVLGHENDPSLGRERARRYSIITVLNWDSYQHQEQGKGREKATKGPGKGPAIINKEEEVKETEKKQRRKNKPIDVTWNGERLDVPDVFMEKYRTKYPRLDIPAIIVDVERWLLKNPTKAASYKSFDSFLNNWLRREEEKQRKQNSDDAPYELTGDSLAAAIECANLFGKRAING